jgi:hypothetical protein
MPSFRLEVEVSTAESRSNHETHPLWPVAVLAAVVGGHLLLALLLRLVGSFGPEWAQLVMLGAWMTQPILFGQWLALGPGNATTRFQLTTLLVAAIIAFGRLGDPTSEIDPHELAIRAAEFVVAAALLFALRRLAGWRIDTTDHVQTNHTSPMRFNIRSMMRWFAFWAVLLTICRYAWLRVDGSLSGRSGEIAIGTAIFALVFGPIALLALAMLARTWVSGLPIALAITWPFCLIALIVIGEFIDPYDSGFFLVALVISCGGILAACLTALPMRFAGYRFFSALPRARLAT